MLSDELRKHYILCKMMQEKKVNMNEDGERSKKWNEEGEETWGMKMMKKKRKGNQQHVRKKVSDMRWKSSSRQWEGKEWMIKSDLLTYALKIRTEPLSCCIVIKTFCLGKAARFISNEAIIFNKSINVEFFLFTWCIVTCMWNCIW